MSYPTGQTNAHHLTGLSHALDLAARGWPVVPYLDRPDNKQLTSWPTAATTNTDLLLRWFDDDQTYAGCYVGVVPGNVGKTVIDIDRHDQGTDGFQTLHDLDISSDALVSGVSRSGIGKHLWFDGTGTSRPIYAGVDRKSLKGLVRVPYLLPEVEDVFEVLPAHFNINNNETTGREFTESTQTWIDLNSNKPISTRVRSVLDDTPDPFTGHGNMLRTQTRLVMLAGEGDGGVPETLVELAKRWGEAPHTSGDSRQNWARGLAGAITAFGGEASPDEEKASPSQFFDSDKGGFQPAKLAKAISHDLAVGPGDSIWLYEDGVYRPKDDEIERRHAQALGDMFRSTQLTTVRKLVLHTQNLPVIEVAPDPGWLNLANGMLDWKTGELSAHDPQYRSTVQLPVEWDREAKCDEFETWLSEVIPADSHQLVWESLGYILLSGNPMAKAILLFGPAGTGKSTFLNVIQRMLGNSNYSNLSLKAISAGRFDKAELFGKTANICGDLDKGFIEDPSVFKQITGGDKITVERKGQHPFQMKVWAKPIFSANEAWRTSDTGDSYYRRWLVLSFPNRVMNTRSFAEDDLLAEAPGILVKAVEALRSLMARGKFELSGSSLALFDEFKRENDMVRMWLDSDESVTWDVGNTTLRTLRSTVYARYCTWCERVNLKPKSAIEFNKSLRQIGLTELKSGAWHIVGLSVPSIPTTSTERSIF